jgi:gliding motility-associated lipoprotein GldH
MAKRISLHLAGLVAGLLLIAGCQSNNVYQDVKDIPGEGWSKNNILSYKFNISDTLQPYHVLLNIRNTTKYPYRNLYLFIETTSPQGHSVRDTFECTLADERGRWYGKGWGDVYENEIPYKQYIRFPDSGTYTIDIQQAMRTNSLKHITDIGVIVEKAKNPSQ